MRKSRYVAAMLVVLCAAPASRAQQPQNLTGEQVDKWMSELSNWGRWGGTGFPLNPIATF